MNYFLLPNPLRPQSLACAQELASYFCRHGQQAFAPADCGMQGVKEITPADLPEDTVVISLGGDGTLLQAVRRLGRFDLPVASVNFGHVGFLTQCGPEGAFLLADSLINGQYSVHNRLLLRLTLHRADGEKISCLAVNEAMISRGNCNRAIHITMGVDGQIASPFAADGVIVSTPTGSTAYNMACGGPILWPDCRVIAVKAVASRLFGAHALVLPESVSLTFTVSSPDGDPPDMRPYLMADSFERYPLLEGDRVTVTRAEETLKTVALPQNTFIENLYEHLTHPS